MGEQRNLGVIGVGVKQVALALAVVFIVTLAVVVGRKMSTDATAVVIGVVCGVAASIPTSVLLLVVLARHERQRDDDTGRRAGLDRGAYPPVVVIQGGAPQGLPAGPQAGYWPAPSQGPLTTRQYQVVGGDDLLLHDGL